MDPVASTSSLPAPRPRRQRTRTTKALNSDDEDFAGPKIKLKMGGGGGDSTGIDTSGIGWDRELDSDADVPLAVEEHFLLRLPPHVAPVLREMVEQRNVTPDVWFKFKDSRRAVFHLGDKLYGAKLVDLPALLESQKLTGSGGQSVKVADLSQMLLVEEEVQEEGEVTRDRFNIEDFIYPHGVTPPLKHVRKRRFRKRINKRVRLPCERRWRSELTLRRRRLDYRDCRERRRETPGGRCESGTSSIRFVFAPPLLSSPQANCRFVSPELLDHDVPSDDEYGSPGPGARDSSIAPTPHREGSMSSLAADGDDGEGMREADGDREEEEEEDDEAGSGYDSDLANEINKGMQQALNASASDDSGSDAGGLFGGSSDDDEDEEEEEQAVDPEVLEQRKRIKLLLEETGDVERAIAAKELELAKAANPIFKVSFSFLLVSSNGDRELTLGDRNGSRR
jgi:transcription initiation factor TFIID subunit 7